MGLLIRVITFAGLLADAVVHWVYAPDMSFAEGGAIGGDTLFRVQAVLALLAGVIVLVRATRATYALAFLVAASAVGALLLYHYVEVGALGPLPSMDDPIWYTEKVVSAVGEGIAAITAVIGFVLVRPRAQRSTPSADRDLSHQT